MCLEELAGKIITTILWRNNRSQNNTWKSNISRNCMRKNEALQSFLFSNDFLTFWYGRWVRWCVLLLRLDWVTRGTLAYMYQTLDITVYEGEQVFPVLQFELSQTKASLQKKHLLLLELICRRRWSCSRGQDYPHPNPHQVLSSSCKAPSDVGLQM